LELNYEGFAQEWVTDRRAEWNQETADCVGSQARPVFVLGRRYANTRAPTYSLNLAATHVTPSPMQVAAASTMKSLSRA
jgi:hypothetical protein